MYIYLRLFSAWFLKICSVPRDCILLVVGYEIFTGFPKIGLYQIVYPIVRNMTWKDPDLIYQKLT